MGTSLESHVANHYPEEHGGRLAYRPHLHKEPLTDFSTNTTPLGTPHIVLEAIKKSAAGIISEYPEPVSRQLTEGLAKYVGGLSRRNIVAGNGATEIIYNAALAFANTGYIMMQAPTFLEYESASMLYNGKRRIVNFESMNLADDLDAFVKNITDYDTAMTFVCNPNNPTGKLLSQKQVLKIIDAAAAVHGTRRKCHIMVDECFIEMSSDPQASVISHVNKYENLIVLRSMTKSFGLAGMRLGYAAASEDIADLLYRIKVPWSVNGMAQAAGIAALSEAEQILAKTRQVIRAETAYMQKRLSEIDGVYAYDTDANFILLKTDVFAETLQEILANTYKILIRDCSVFKGMPDLNHSRIAIKNHKENAALMRALQDVMG